MKTRLYIFFALVIFSPFYINAQKQYEVKNAKDLENIFFLQKTKYQDTLCKNVKQSGIIFIKFQINKEGALDSIRYSEKQPGVLLYVITQTLNTVKMIPSGSSLANKSYVLPILYNYIPEIKLPVTAEQILDQTPKIDANNLMSYLNFDNNGFFNVSNSQKDLWGMQCVLLPMIRISRPVVLDKENTWPAKSN